jgi:hypothetical protein
MEAVSDSVNSVAMMVGPSAGAAMIGLDPRLLGVIPAIAALIGILLPAWNPQGETKQADLPGALANVRSPARPGVTPRPNRG